MSTLLLSGNDVRDRLQMPAKTYLVLDQGDFRAMPGVLSPGYESSSMPRTRQCSLLFGGICWQLNLYVPIKVSPV